MSRALALAPRRARRLPPKPVAPPAFGAVEPLGPRPVTRAPTDLGGAKILQEEDPTHDPEALRASALARGHLLHLALEHLPATSPETVAALLAATEEAALAGDDQPGQTMVSDLL